LRRKTLAMTPTVTPFLRWAGSKRQLLPKLSRYYTPGRRYFEPFVGSAALFFAVHPMRAVLSDINLDLIETFVRIRDNFRGVSTALEELSTGEKSYYSLRALDPKSLDPLQRAARFIFLNRYCFNGLYRTNLSGKFNVPFSPTKTGALPSREHLEACSRRLSKSKLVCSDFEDILLSEVRAGDFVYLDPPFAVENRRVFRQYGPTTFGFADLERLGKLLCELHERGAHFVLSYAYCSESRRTFNQWKTRRVYTQRNIAGFAKHRRRAVELIVSNIEEVY